jgi:hypothetical protein
MGGQAEQRRDQALFPETTETRLKDVFEAYEKLEKELRQHIEQLRLAGWLEAGGEDELVADPAEYEPTEYNEDTIDARYILR